MRLTLTLLNLARKNTRLAILPIYPTTPPLKPHHCGLTLGPPIRGRTPYVVKLEIGILLLAYNLMRYVIARGRNGKAKPSCGIASTAAAVKAFLDVVQCAFRAGRSLARAFARLIALVVSDKLNRRKRRPNVRAVKRRPKPYRLLMNPRSQYTPEECV